MALFFVAWGTRKRAIPVLLSCSLAGIAGSNPTGLMSASFSLVCCQRPLHGLITRPEESYRVWCVSVIVVLDNEEALAHWRLLHHKKIVFFFIFTEFHPPASQSSFYISWWYLYIVDGTLCWVAASWTTFLWSVLDSDFLESYCHVMW